MHDGFTARVLTHHLLCNHNHGLDGEATMTMIKQILQTRAEQIYNEDVVKAFLTKVVDIGDASWGGLARGKRGSRGGLTAPNKDLISPVFIS